MTSRAAHDYRFMKRALSSPCCTGNGTANALVAMIEQANNLVRLTPEEQCEELRRMAHVMHSVGCSLTARAMELEDHG